jgi:hypothetical protein
MERSGLDAEIQRLRAGKAALRRARLSASLEDKIQALLRLQRVYVDIVGSQRALSPRQRPWNITSSVRDAMTVSEDAIEFRPLDTFSASQTHWVRPRPVAVRT